MPTSRKTWWHPESRFMRRSPANCLSYAKRVAGVLHTPGRRAFADLRSDQTGQSVLQHENQAGS